MQSISPLRYPGGKSQLADFIISIINKNNLSGGKYVEPFAGGSGLALLLLFNGHMSKIYINDIDYAIYSFWYSILNYTDEFCKLVYDVKIDMDCWKQQKKIHTYKEQFTPLEVGFSTFFLNRTNRSGIIKGGVIGGKFQDGNYKMDCRFNKKNLVKRIENIANRSKDIVISNLDAIDFLDRKQKTFSDNTLINLDPPYYNKGQQLYVNFYKHNDHLKLQEYIADLRNCYWLITYDNTEEINEMYKNFNKIDVSVNYSAAKKRVGKEILIYSSKLII